MLGLVNRLGRVGVNMGSAAEFEGCDLFCCHLHKEDDKTCTFLFYLCISTLKAPVFCAGFQFFRITDFC